MQRAVTLSKSEYMDKMRGCWLGKSIGGTLGAPFEPTRGAFDVDYYTVDLSEGMLPNDDLDLQLVRHILCIDVQIDGVLACICACCNDCLLGYVLAVYFDGEVVVCNVNCGGTVNADTYCIAHYKTLCGCLECYIWCS